PQTVLKLSSKASLPGATECSRGRRKARKGEEAGREPLSLMRALGEGKASHMQQCMMRAGRAAVRGESDIPILVVSSFLPCSSLLVRCSVCFVFFFFLFCFFFFFSAPPISPFRLSPLVIAAPTLLLNILLTGGTALTWQSSS